MMHWSLFKGQFYSENMLLDLWGDTGKKDKTGFVNFFNILVLEQMKTQEEACQHLSREWF